MNKLIILLILLIPSVSFAQLSPKITVEIADNKSALEYYAGATLVSSMTYDSGTVTLSANSASPMPLSSYKGLVSQANIWFSTITQNLDVSFFENLPTDDYKFHIEKNGNLLYLNLYKIVSGSDVLIYSITYDSADNTVTKNANSLVTIDWNNIRTFKRAIKIFLEEVKNF